MVELILQPFLAFKDPTREAKWQLFYASKRVNFDQFGAYTCILQLTLGTLFALSRGKTGCTKIIGLSWVLHLAHLYLLWCYTNSYQQHRSKIVVVLLALARTITALLIPGCSADDTTTTKLLYKTGVIPLLWYSIIMPLPCRYQLPAQVLTILLYQRHLIISGCSFLMGDSDLLLGLHKTWQLFRQGLSYMLMLQGVMADVNVTQQYGDMHVCWHSVMLMQLVLGIVLPAPIHYMMELRLRRQFYAQELAAAATAAVTATVFPQQQQERQAQASCSSSSSSSSNNNRNGGGAEQLQPNSNSRGLDVTHLRLQDLDWEGPFYVPLTAVLLHTLVLATLVSMGLYKLGPYALRWQGILAGGMTCQERL